ncbi:Kinesin-4 [Hexamita inflata]|uniref:Kinesin-like protein n=2 Tax=Hexamita inflata TaxID=28002 RepID=A0AA86RPU6_9EUKA|nr:Kinesin-4 [Hexamita inflata]
MKQTQNITVAVRIRPALQYELAKTTDISIENEKQHIIMENKQSLKFDLVYGPDSNQQVIAEQLAYPMIEQFINGYSASIMAYGQTSSGKSFTLGVPDQQLYKQFPKMSENVGLIPRAILNFFSSLQQKDVQSIVKVQYIEVYNEQLRDLLTTEQTEIQIRERLVNGYIQIYTTGANEVQVKTAKEALSCFVNGGINRATAATALNQVSSRSHAIFTISLEQIMSNGEILKSKLNLVDLAGSERFSKTHTTGQQFKEMVGINQGLLCLGNVIKVLSDKDSKTKAVHVPYRDSKLTRLLQDSIGGTAKCVFIACVSPSKYNFEESQITLKYAARARNIINKPIRVVERAIQDEAAFAKLHEENEMLKEYIQQMTLKQAQLDQELQNVRSANDPGSVYFSQNGFQQTNNQTFLQINQSPVNMNQTLAMLMNEPQQNSIKEMIEAVSEKVSNIQTYNTKQAGDLYNRLQQLIFKLSPNLNLNQQTLKQLLQNKGQIPQVFGQLTDHSTILFQVSAFLMQFIRFENAYERQLLRNEGQIQFSDAFFGADKPDPNLIQQVLDEVAFTNQLKNELKTAVGFTKADKFDNNRFQTEEIQFTREFVQNQDIINQKIKTRGKEEQQFINETQNQQKVVILDVDEEFQEIQFETDLVVTQRIENDDYDFENFDFINQKSDTEEDLDEDGESQEEYDETEDSPAVDLEKKFMDSLQKQQAIKNPPSIYELSQRLHSLENYFTGKSRQEIEQILQEAEKKKILENSQVNEDENVNVNVSKPAVQQSQKPIVQSVMQEPQMKTKSTPNLPQSSSQLRNSQLAQRVPAQPLRVSQLETKIPQPDLSKNDLEHNTPMNLKQLNRSQSGQPRNTSGYQQLPAVTKSGVKVIQPTDDKVIKIEKKVPQSAQLTRPQLADAESGRGSSRILQRSQKK